MQTKELPTMTISPLRRAALGAVLIAGLGGTALAQPPAATGAANTPIGSLAPGGVTVEGQVTDVFGNRFVLQDSTGRILVEAGPDWYHRLDIRQGERLRVTGRPDGRAFDAHVIRREDGREIVVRRAEGPPPWAGRGGREERVEGGIDRAAAIRAAEAAGYRIRGDVEPKRRHWEIEATNARGERVEIHIDLAGRITREEWDRD
jgi:hypothetical protein